MARRKRLSDAGVAALKPRAARYAEPDPELGGHYVRVTPSGSKSFVAVARDPAGKQVWATIDAVDKLTIEQAREKAREAIKRIRSGLPPFEAPATKQATFRDVAERWLQRHVAAKGLRSEGEIRRKLATYVFPAWGDRSFDSIRRTDVVTLLDQLEDERGAAQADAVLATVSGVMHWHAARHDDYTAPLVRGMRRGDPRIARRARILDDDELRAIWSAAETNGTFGAFIRIALLTAQRREKLATMRWEDVSVDGEWRVRSEDREKGTGGALVLPTAAVDIIRAQPRLASNPYVFAGRGCGHLSGFSRHKQTFDALLPTNMPPWIVHDLRRTARSLMSRAGVRPDIAERVLGHAIAGVEGVYDRHSYREEKADALRRLAQLIESIVLTYKSSGDCVEPA